VGTAKPLLGNIDQLVSFNMNKEEFSFPINTVQEIVRLSKVTTVPGAPKSVKGIINLRGSILPLIDLRKHLGLSAAEDSDETRIVVVRHQETSTGMIVDRVNEVLHVEDNELEPPPSAVESSRATWLRGIAKINDGKRVVMVLSEDKLLPNASASVKEMLGQSTSTTSQEEDMTMDDERLLVTFRLADEEFGVNITEVREIVRIGKLVRVPQAPPYVLGVMLLRNALLPVIDLRILFGMNTGAKEVNEEMPDNETDSSRIVVADLDGVTTGLLVDAVSEVLRLPEKDLEPAPAVIDSDKAKYLHGVGKLNNGSRLLMLLDLLRLLSVEEKETVAAAAGEQLEKGEVSMGRAKELEDERQLVCFRIAAEEYGIDIMRVREIIRVEAITAVPGAPSYVSGIVNLRGDILPVIDLRLRFGRDGSQCSELNRILVVEMEGRAIGLIVDAVSEVLRIPASKIEPTPQILAASMSSQNITGIGKLDDGDRTIILVDTDTILEQNEIEALDGGGNDTRASARNEMATGAMEKAATKNTADEQASRKMSAQDLMALKKDELLAKAGALGLNADKKMTKKLIAGLIAEHGQLGKEFQ